MKHTAKGERAKRGKWRFQGENERWEEAEMRDEREAA